MGCAKPYTAHSQEANYTEHQELQDLCTMLGSSLNQAPFLQMSMRQPLMRSINQALSCLNHIMLCTILPCTIPANPCCTVWRQGRSAGATGWLALHPSSEKSAPTEHPRFTDVILAFYPSFNDCVPPSPSSVTLSLSQEQEASFLFHALAKFMLQVHAKPRLGIHDRFEANSHVKSQS